MNHKILHLSDLHFGPTFQPSVAASALAFAEDLKPRLCIISGDFTQRARVDQFVEARTFITQLRKHCERVITTPGNHDIPLYRLTERMLSPYEHYREYISPDLDSFISLDGCAIASLNSTSPYTRLKGGRLTEQQLTACKTFFAQQPKDHFRIATWHHHVFPIPSFESQDYMPNAKHILDLLTEWRVDLILTGHIHRSFIGDSLDVYSGHDRDRGVLVVSCGTTTSRRGRGPEREKNSLNLIELSGESVTVTHHMYFSAAGKFLPRSRHDFLRPSHAPLNQTSSLTP